MNLNNLIKEAYETAKEKGWHDNPIPFADYIANIHAEISKAWEEWRNDRKLNEIYYEKCQECMNFYRICESCQRAKPCGIPIELADVVIRICDMFGEYGRKQNAYIDVTRIFPETTFPEFINWCHEFVISETPESLEDLIFFIENYCAVNGIDLEKAIEIKMEYNKTRPYKHGGKRV